MLDGGRTVRSRHFAGRLPTKARSARAIFFVALLAVPLGAEALHLRLSRLEGSLKRRASDGIGETWHR
jgi:hypothetical protein